MTFRKAACVVGRISILLDDEKSEPEKIKKELKNLIDGTGSAASLYLSACLSDKNLNKLKEVVK